jgi:hypothetical protein
VEGFMGGVPGGVETAYPVQVVSDAPERFDSVAFLCVGLSPTPPIPAAPSDSVSLGGRTHQVRPRMNVVDQGMTQQSNTNTTRCSNH